MYAYVLVHTRIHYVCNKQPPPPSRDTPGREGLTIFSPTYSVLTSTLSNTPHVLHFVPQR
ncbi:unnamed protein product [Periconia digitata]|uniref:Uncharacterized protein n=1 Tax=Periconia digitata TaxID=1303443 RepID=A0A9W4UCY4_9PLEO|nr:unnamed protein product [Periconia digitata]